MNTLLDPSAPTLDADIARLRLALARVRTWARRWVWIETLGLLCLWAAAVFWVSLLVDWMFEPPWQVRAATLVAAGIGLGWLLATKLVGRLAAPLPDAQLALLVERADPYFRDSLSTAIELSAAGRADASRPLLARTSAEAVGRLESVHPASIFRRRSLGSLAGTGLLAAASVCGLMVSRPESVGLWASRMLLLRDISWPRSVRLEAEGFVDGVRVVPRGSDVEVLVRAAADVRLPDVVDLRSRGSGPRGRGWRTDRMGTRGGRTDEGQVFGHVFKAVGESLDLEVRGGDARLRPLRLRVVDAPSLAELAITISLPDYLGGGTRRATASRVVPVPRGSDVEITVTASKDLSAASMAVIDEGAETPIGGPSTVGTDPEPRSVVGRLDDLLVDRTVVVHLTDTDGIVNRTPITFVISALPDQPPQAALRLHGISTAVTSMARIPIIGTIADDHGLASADVTVSMAAADSEGDPPGRDAVQPITRVRPGATEVELTAEAPEEVLLQPLAPAVGGRLTLSVTAVDGCPLEGGPNRGAGGTWTLDIVAPEALQAMLEAREVILRRRFESVLTDCEQARDRIAAEAPHENDAAPAPARMGESAGRAAGEIAEIATAFREIQLELRNNGLLTPELEIRLIRQIADPLSAIAGNDLPPLVVACRGAANTAAARRDLVRRADDVLARMRAVLGMMVELESFNEVIERLRGVIRTQEQIRSDTLEQQKRRAREALEGL
jgi:hypothetical protein